MAQWSAEDAQYLRLSYQLHAIVAIHIYRVLGWRETDSEITQQRKDRLVEDQFRVCCICVPSLVRCRQEFGRQTQSARSHQPMQNTIGDKRAAIRRAAAIKLRAPETFEMHRTARSKTYSNSLF